MFRSVCLFICLCYANMFPNSMKKTWRKLRISSFFHIHFPFEKEKERKEKMHMPLSLKWNKTPNLPPFLLKIHMVREIGIVESVEFTPCMQVSSDPRPSFAIRWERFWVLCLEWSRFVPCLIRLLVMWMSTAISQFHCMGGYLARKPLVPTLYSSCKGGKKLCRMRLLIGPQTVPYCCSFCQPFSLSFSYALLLHHLPE